MTTLKIPPRLDPRWTGCSANHLEPVDIVSGRVEENNEYFRESIIGYGLEADSYLSWFEKSQMEYEGFIQFPETRVEWSQIEAEVLV